MKEIVEILNPIQIEKELSAPFTYFEIIRGMEEKPTISDVNLGIIVKDLVIKFLEGLFYLWVVLGLLFIVGISLYPYFNLIQSLYQQLFGIGLFMQPEIEVVFYFASIFTGIGVIYFFPSLFPTI